MKTLLSFGSDGYENGLRGLRDSARRYFDEVVTLGTTDLSDDYWAHKDIVYQKRGYGYYLWKPYLILRHLRSLGDADYLMYSDALVRFVCDPAPLFSLVEANDGLALFKAGGGNVPNRVWTKADCFNLMGCAGERYTRGVQLAAGFSVLRRTARSLAFVEEWFNYCTDPRILTDAPNVTGGNLPGFKDHRHDQSVLSLLAIKHGLKTSRDLSQWGNNAPDAESNYRQIVDLHRRR